MNFLIDLLDSLFEATGIELISQALDDPSDDATETILAIPGYRQTKSYTCGFAAGLMVLHTFRPKASITNFYYEVNPIEEWGTSTGKLVAALRKFRIGVKVKKKMTFDEIAEAIEDGTPIIACIDKGEEQHWVVIYGYSVGPNRLFVAGNNIPGLPMGTDTPWSKFRKLIPSDTDWLICWGK
jgi:Peptidase C39 family